MDWRSYHPYNTPTFGKRDEIAIRIPQQDFGTLPCQSYLYVEGELSLLEDKPQGSTDDVCLDNNCVSFMFDRIRYQLNGVEIDRSDNPGITTTLKNYLSLSTERSRRLDNAGWSYEDDRKRVCKATTEFNFCVPLNMLLGFCEDYKRIVKNASHELILTRAETDTNALYGSANLKPLLKLHKIQWQVPHVSSKETLRSPMFPVSESSGSVKMSFRSWNLHKYLMLNAYTQHTWRINTPGSLKNPRYVIFALQTARENDLTKKITRFDSCKLSYLRLCVNSETYQYYDLNLDFDKGKYAMVYEMYAKCKESYYGCGEPLLDVTDFIMYGPFIAINCTKNCQSIAPANIQIEFECKENVPPNTSAYCLIIHDRVIEYKP